MCCIYEGRRVAKFAWGGWVGGWVVARGIRTSIYTQRESRQQAPARLARVHPHTHKPPARSADSTSKPLDSVQPGYVHPSLPPFFCSYYALSLFYPLSPTQPPIFIPRGRASHCQFFETLSRKTRERELLGRPLIHHARAINIRTRIFQIIIILRIASEGSRNCFDVYPIKFYMIFIV